MLKSTKLAQENNTLTLRLNELNSKGEGELTNEERGEMDTSNTRLDEIAVEYRSSLKVENTKETTTVINGEQTPEQRERIELRGKCRVGTFLACISNGRAVVGAEGELAGELKLDGNQIPTELWNKPPEQRQYSEHRAVTPAPSTVGVNMQAIEPFLFSPSIAARLGIVFRSVPSGTLAIPTITTAPSTAAPKAKSTGTSGTNRPADSTAGAITVGSSTAKRVPAKLEMTYEDITQFGHESLESSLRETMSMKLSDSLDFQVIQGSGSGNNLNGLINQLSIPNSRTMADAVSWATAVALMPTIIDGLWATRLQDLQVALGVDSYQKLAGAFLQPTGASGTPGDMSALDYLQDKLGDIFTNKRMPAAATVNSVTDQQVMLVARRGQAVTTAVIGDWGRITVDDIFSNASDGIRNFVISAMIGSPILVQADAFYGTYINAG